MSKGIFIKAEREGYSKDQIRNTMTVGELIGYLEQFDEDSKVYLKHDGGYTYGGITWGSFEDDDDSDDCQDDLDE